MLVSLLWSRWALIRSPQSHIGRRRYRCCTGRRGGEHLHFGTVTYGASSVCRRNRGGRRSCGGITNRVDVKAVVDLGASGVWVGTAFVATRESLAHDVYKRRLVEASTDDTEYRTGYSFGWKYGTPHRVIPNRDKWNLVRLVGGGARVIDKPEIAEKLSLFAGQGVGKIKRILGAAELVSELANGFSTS